jgi:hypothetical protein
MGAIGTADSNTVIPACYFAVLTAVMGRIISDKPNDIGEPRREKNFNHETTK